MCSQLKKQLLLCSCRRNKLTLLPLTGPPSSPTHSLIKCLWSWVEPLVLRTCGKGREAPIGRRKTKSKDVFFKRPTKQKVQLVLLLIWKNFFFYFVLRNN